MNRETALTLIELLIVLAMLATISIAATPGFYSIIDGVRMGSNVNELVHSLHRVRHNALVTGIATAVCSSADGRQCERNSGWENGWLIFANHNADDPPQVDPGESILDSRGPIPNMRIYANRRAFIMRPFGLRSTNGTLIWCDRRGENHARAIVVSYTGKPRISETDSKGRHYNCPETD
jgi:type IV fimbrial biogenesis protein FimT